MELNKFNTEARPQEKHRIALPGWYLALWGVLVAIIDSIGVDAISTKVGSWTETDEDGNHGAVEGKAKLSVFVTTELWDALVNAFCEDQASDEGVCEFGPKSTPKSGAKALLSEYIKKAIVPDARAMIQAGDDEKLIPVIYVGEPGNFSRLVDGGEFKATNPASRSARKGLRNLSSTRTHSGLRGKTTVTK